MRPWVLTTKGRRDKLGTSLECLFCDMPSIPTEARVYKITNTFDQASIPAGLLQRHSTRPGTWGDIVVSAGRLAYELDGPAAGNWVLKPGVEGVIPPEIKHAVRPVGDVSFHIEFLRVPTKEQD